MPLSCLGESAMNGWDGKGDCAAYREMSYEEEACAICDETEQRSNDIVTNGGSLCGDICE